MWEELKFYQGLLVSARKFLLKVSSLLFRPAHCVGVDEWIKWRSYCLREERFWHASVFCCLLVFLFPYSTRNASVSLKSWKVTLHIRVFATWLQRAVSSFACLPVMSPLFPAGGCCQLSARSSPHSVFQTSALSRCIQACNTAKGEKKRCRRRQVGVQF